MNSELLANLQRCHELPSIPAVAAQAVALARDPDTDFNAVAAVLEQDPAVAGKLLRRANAAYYGQVRTHSTVTGAVRLLGIRDSLTIGLTFSLIDRLRAKKYRSLNFAWFWRRSLLAGVYARNLAKLLGRRDIEEAFLAALLQDIGMMALDQVTLKLYEGIADADNYHNAAHQVERDRVNGDHSVVSAWLLAQWGLPSTLIQAVSRSHYANQTGELCRSNELDRMVMLSGVLADMWLNPAWEDQFNHARALAIALLGLSDRDVGCVIGMAGPDTEEVGALFSIDLMGPRETRDVLDAAAELLEQRRPPPMHRGE